MAKKMGRPRLEDGKRNTLSIKAMGSEFLALRSYADSHGITITQLLRKGVFLVFADGQEAWQQCKSPFLGGKEKRWQNRGKTTRAGHNGRGETQR